MYVYYNIYLQLYTYRCVSVSARTQYSRIRKNLVAYTRKAIIHTFSVFISFFTLFSNGTPAGSWTI